MDGSGCHQKLAFKKSSRVLGGIFAIQLCQVLEKRLFDPLGRKLPNVETRVNMSLNFMNLICHQINIGKIKQNFREEETRF